MHGDENIVAAEFHSGLWGMWLHDRSGTTVVVRQTGTRPAGVVAGQGNLGREGAVVGFRRMIAGQMWVASTRHARHSETCPVALHCGGDMSGPASACSYTSPGRVLAEPKKKTNVSCLSLPVA